MDCRRFAAVGLLWGLAHGCSAPAQKPPLVELGVSEPAIDAAAANERAEKLAVADAIGEIEAREILANVFRTAGYRILYDVNVGSPSNVIALDGYDPLKKVGYEYVDPGELKATTDLRAAKLGSVLVVEPTSRDNVRELALKFVTDRAAQAE